MLLYEHINIPEWETISLKYQHLEPDVQKQKSLMLDQQDWDFIGSIILDPLAKHTGKIHKIKTGIIFAQAPGSVQKMHVDGFSVERQGACNWALNIPIAEVGVMSWYGGEYDLVKGAGQGIGYLEPAWHGEMHTLDSVAVDQPTIVKINVPHQVINHSSKRRLVLSLRFTPDIC